MQNSRMGDDLVFLIGAGRSGTTLLYKILAAHEGVAYLSNYQSRWPLLPQSAVLHRVLNMFPSLKRKAWFEDKGGAYFDSRRPIIKAIVPTPAEAESLYAACSLPFSPEVDFHLDESSSKKLRRIMTDVKRYAGGQVLLSKRTANNRRIAILREVFPKAKFVHLIRDGRAVAHSLLRVGWWDDHVVYWSNKTPKRMVSDGANSLEIAARNWVEEMNSISIGTEVLEKECLLEVRYDDLLSDAPGTIRTIVSFMGLSESVRHSTLVRSLRLSMREEPWRKTWTTDEVRLVEEIQLPTLRKWGLVEVER